MLQNLLACSVIAFTLCASVPAQHPGGAPPAPARDAVAAKEDALRRAFVEADGNRKGAIAAAADQVLKEGVASRTRFLETVRAITAVAPKVAATPAPAPAVGAPSTGAPATGAPATRAAGSAPAEAKPVDLADDVKLLMTSVVTGAPEASKAALAKLVEDKQAGSLALARLDERGKAILARCVVGFVRKKMETNAVYAGQFDDLRDFQPEAGPLLLRWAEEAPKDVTNPEPFRSACLRALRDVVAADQATDATRKSLREIAGKAEKARNLPLLRTAVCAMHQYGDPSAFDKIKAEFEKQAAVENVKAKTVAIDMLAQLHYELRNYEDAANYYKTLVDLQEKAEPPPQGLTTVIYNAACSLSLAKRTDEAFQYLEKALQTGAKGQALSKAMIDEDHDMNNLRADPRFQKLMEQFFGKPAPAGK